MKLSEIKEMLCSYDKRNPNFIEGEKTGFCDNCFSGRDQLANELLKARTTKIKKELIMPSIKIEMNLENDCFQNISETNLNIITRSIIDKTLHQTSMHKDTIKRIKDTNGNSIGLLTYLI